MDWSDERYVRLYTRDTADWLGFTFEAQALLALILRKLDRAGVLELGKHGKRAVAIAIGHPGEWGRLEPALEELLADGCLVLDGNRLVMPNFLPAQEAVQNDRVRKAESRARRRELSATRLSVNGSGDNNTVTNRDSESQIVTKSHARSQTVTDGHSVPSRAVPSRAEKDGEQEEFTLTPPAPPEVSPVTRLRRAFVGWFEQTYGEPPRWSAKDSGIAASLLQFGDVDAVMAKVRGAAAEKWRERRVTLAAVLAGWNEIVPAAAPKPRQPTAIEVAMAEDEARARAAAQGDA